MDNISLDHGSNTFVDFQVPWVVLAVLRLIVRVCLCWAGSNKMRVRNSIPFHYFRSEVGDMDFEWKDWDIRLRGVRRREVDNRTEP